MILTENERHVFKQVNEKILGIGHVDILDTNDKPIHKDHIIMMILRVLERLDRENTNTLNDSRAQ